MKTLFMTALVLFSAQVLAGPLYYTEKEGLTENQLTAKVVSIELEHHVWGNKEPYLIIKSSMNQSCQVHTRDGVASPSEERTSRIYQLYQTLLAAIKAHKNVDGTYTVLVCANRTGGAKQVNLITYVKQE